jgi:dihydrofolate synthase/folylpolyglutamate synthase
MQTATGLSTYLENLQRFGIQPGLERIHALLDRAGNPQLQYPIILVGGTNGKGSTCEFLARLLENDGKKVGLYTSPHLYMWNERIRVLGDGKWERGEVLFPGAISHEELDTLFADALPHIQAVADSELGQPTEFEVLTFLGLWHFARQKVDAAVVEVGLGGKWDATNATEPTVSVITHVALDHCDRLGNTLQAIASDKVEIARSGRSLVTTETKPEVLAVFQEYCAKIGCRLIKTQNSEPQADFQQLNLQTAQTAYRVLCETLGWPFNSKLTIPTSKLAVTGRFETICQKPRVILDGANNPDGAQILASQLKNALVDSPNAKLILVLGILLDKDYAAMTEILAPLAQTVIATQSHSPRAAATALVAKEAKRYCSHVEESTTPQTALERALELAGENDIICVTGSFYTISEIQR